MSRWSWIPASQMLAWRSEHAASRSRMSRTCPAKPGRAAWSRRLHALAEAQATVRSLRTQLAHAELAHAEALAAERRAREAAETALRDARAAREAADAPTAEPPPKRTRAAKPARKTTVKPSREPEPVKWWLPSYKARKG